MTKDEIYSILHKIFYDIFDRDDIVLNDATTASDIEEWDSLTHISLIAAIENEFNIRFDMKTILSMKNVGDLTDAIMERL